MGWVGCRWRQVDERAVDRSSLRLTEGFKVNLQRMEMMFVATMLFHAIFLMCLNIYGFALNNKSNTFCEQERHLVRRKSSISTWTASFSKRTPHHHGQSTGATHHTPMQSSN